MPSKIAVAEQIWFLEQGRDARPSQQVLAALAAALRLSPAERDHLFQLAGTTRPPVGEPQAETIAPALAAMVNRLDPWPAYLKGGRWDVLAANRAARVLFADWPARAPTDRNLLRWIFTEPAARKIYVHWQHEAAQCSPGSAPPPPGARTTLSSPASSTRCTMPAPK